MAAPHKYPTGRADFESIINEGFVYVDKTERMYEMIGDRKNNYRAVRVQVPQTKPHHPF